MGVEWRTPGCLSEQVFITERDPRRECDTENERAREGKSYARAAPIWPESLARDRHAVQRSYGIYPRPDLAGRDRISRWTPATWTDGDDGAPNAKFR